MPSMRKITEHCNLNCQLLFCGRENIIFLETIYCYNCRKKKITMYIINAFKYKRPLAHSQI